MALISMCVYSTEENNKDECLQQTLFSLYNTVNFSKHRLMLSVNGFTPTTNSILKEYSDIIQKVIYNDTNLGTAKGINKIWAYRDVGEHCVKMDDDVVISYDWWADDLEYALEKDKTIGIVGLKRKDLEQRPDHETEFFRSQLYFIPHEKGERWMVGEVSADIMGTCVMVRSELIDKLGGLRQPHKYGYDDVDLSIRSRLLGYKNCFLPHIEIDHIDKGGTEYQRWKESEAARSGQEFADLIHGYKNGTISTYYKD